MIDENKYERIITIGDLHGYREPLLILLEKLRITDKDLLIFIGDYIDRGPESKDVVDKLIEMKFVHKNLIFLKGNHEDMILGSMGFPAVIKDFNTWLYNGGTKTLLSYGMEIDEIVRVSRAWDEGDRIGVIMGSVPKSHQDFFMELKLFVETENFFFCHAGIDPLSTIEKGKKNTFNLLWMRDHIFSEKLCWEKTVVCGHTPLSQVLIREKLICIDTGLYRSGKLSAYDVLSGEIFQVQVSLF